jgi:hypothetical protein
LEYHVSVRLWIPASVALFSLVAILNSSAQTSHTDAAATPSTPPVFPSEGHRGRHGDRPYAIPLIYPIPLPYAVENSNADANADDGDADYQGGPTVFDRRGSGPSSYIPPVRNVPTPHAAQQAETASRTPVPPEPTLLIFKDGRKLEVGNYAIIGAHLLDLTPGHQRVVALAELDLDATRRQNHGDQGEMFQSRPRAN